MILIELRVPAPDPDEVTDREIRDATVMLTWIAVRLLDPRFEDFREELHRLQGVYQ